MARNRKTKMRFKDTKHECPNFELRERDLSLYAHKWVSCQHGYRSRSGRIHNNMSFYVCRFNNLNLMCPHHWIEKGVK